MIEVNGKQVPSCAELAQMLSKMGDRPLFSGTGWYVVNGFFMTPSGMQIASVQCPPAGVSAKESRIGGW